jgi:hypothetical protein
MSDFDDKLARFKAKQGQPKPFTPRTTAFRFSRRLSTEELQAAAERAQLVAKRRQEFERSFPSPKCAR